MFTLPIPPKIKQILLLVVTTLNLLTRLYTFFVITNAAASVKVAGVSVGTSAGQGAMVYGYVSLAVFTIGDIIGLAGTLKSSALFTKIYVIFNVLGCANILYTIIRAGIAGSWLALIMTVLVTILSIDFHFDVQGGKIKSLV